METLLIAAFALFCGGQRDTTVILQPDRVEIVSDGGGLSVQVEKDGERFEASLLDETAALALSERRLDFVAPFTFRKKWEVRPYVDALVPFSEFSGGLFIPGGTTEWTWQGRTCISGETHIDFLRLLYHPWHDHRYFSVAVGFQSFRCAGKGFWYDKVDGRLVKADVPAGTVSHGACLEDYGISFPLSYGFEIDASHTLEVMADVVWWTRASATNLLDDKRFSGFDLDRYHRVTLDVRVSWIRDGFFGYYLKFVPPSAFPAGSAFHRPTFSLGAFLRL